MQTNVRIAACILFLAVAAPSASLTGAAARKSDIGNWSMVMHGAGIRSGQ